MELTATVSREPMSGKKFHRVEGNPIDSLPVPGYVWDTCNELVRLIPHRKLDIVKIVKRIWMAHGDAGVATLINCKHLVESMM